MKYRPCAVCGSKDVEVLHNLKFKLLEGVKLPDNYDIVICNTCDFVYADTSATQDDYDKFYKEHNIYENAASYSDMEKYKKIFDWLNNRWNKDKSILEIGFANGELLKMFKEAGYQQLYGLDPSKSCVDNLSRIGMSTFQGSLLKHDIKEEFDYIILSHVLEHILDIQSAIKNIRDLLRYDGEIYIEVPDLKQYKENSVSPFNYFDIEHINHFTTHSLSNLMEFNGLRVASCGTKKWDIGKGMFYPAVWVVVSKPSPVTDVGTIAYVKDYISECLERRYPEIEELIRTQEEVIVWGTGSLAQRLYTMANLNRCNIKMYVDNNRNKVGTTFGGKHIYHPSDIKINSKILILSVYSTDEIINQIRDMGLKNEIIVLEDGRIK